VTETPGNLLEWDSEFWGLTIGRVTSSALTRSTWPDLDAWARANAVDCLYLLARSDDLETIGTAQEAGFQFVDVRVELSQLPTGVGRPGRIRPYQSADLERIRPIARTHHETTRFYADHHFPRERCGELYETWLVRSCEEGWANSVLVAEADGGQAVGYVTCHLDPITGRGSIGLIAVDQRAQGTGLGSDLVLGALDWFRGQGSDDVVVVTQGANIRAQRVFQRCGFRSSQTGLWFHRWYER
jgi:dTDP-4-amino-4,6-dideoxy-D-galactose acyltransferase